jgi:integrative and conjugative element protein (TIGR02256 family)
MIKIKYENMIISVEETIIEEIRSRRQVKYQDKESGGMVMGSIVNNSNEIERRDYTIPQIGDHQSRYRFIRKKKTHNAILHKKWMDSDGTVMYMGEWHTHPEYDPHYSWQDIRNWKRLLKKSKTYSDYLFFFIGGINFYKIWVGNRINGEIVFIYKGAYDEVSSNSD